MGVAGTILGILLLIFVCWGESSKKKSSGYTIHETNDSRYSEVVDESTDETVFIGTNEQCQDWIESHS